MNIVQIYVILNIIKYQYFVPSSGDCPVAPPEIWGISGEAGQNLGEGRGQSIYIMGDGDTNM